MGRGRTKRGKLGLLNSGEQQTSESVPSHVCVGSRFFFQFHCGLICSLPASSGALDEAGKDGKHRQAVLTGAEGGGRWLEQPSSHKFFLLHGLHNGAAWKSSGLVRSLLVVRFALALEGPR